MLIPVYILSLSISAVILGAYAQCLAVSFGLVSDLESGLILGTGVFFLFASSQLIYMALIQAVVPTRGRTPLISEMLSQAGALLLVPYLANAPMDWPFRLLQKMEPVLYLAAFVVVHLFFKLMTLYSACRAKVASRLPALGWAGAGAICLLGAYAAQSLWSEPDSREPIRGLFSKHIELAEP